MLWLIPADIPFERISTMAKRGIAGRAGDASSTSA
jgi:hypothetical protein